VQVDPIKPTLKAHRTERLKLTHDEPLSNFAFRFNMRRYTERELLLSPSFGPTVVGRCRLTLSNPR